MEERSEKRPAEIIRHELNELEDAYAECMKDDVDVGTLNFIWSRIKALKKELESSGS